MREALLVRKRWVWILVLWVLVPAARDGRAQSNPGKLDYLLAELHDDLLATWPEQSTLLGYDSHATRWTDWSAQGLTERRQLFERYLRSLRDIPEAGLPPASRLNRRLAERALLSWIEGLSFDPYYLRLNPVNGLHLEVQQVLQAMPAESISDYEDILARLRQLPRLAGETVRLSE